MNYNSIATAVVNSIITKSGQLGGLQSSVCLAGSEEHNLTLTGALNNTQAPVHTSGFMQVVDGAQVPVTQTVTVTTTEALPAWSSGISITLPNSNSTSVWYGDPLPNNGNMPWIGDIPNWGIGGEPFYPAIPPITPQPYYQPIKVVPDLESLEEGVHEIPGGKIIIKKIKVTEEQLDEAIQETLGHDATPEEKSKIIKAIEDIAASEEREV